MNENELRNSLSPANVKHGTPSLSESFISDESGDKSFGGQSVASQTSMLAAERSAQKMTDDFAKEVLIEGLSTETARNSSNNNPVTSALSNLPKDESKLADVPKVVVSRGVNTQMNDIATQVSSSKLSFKFNFSSLGRILSRPRE